MTVKPHLTDILAIEGNRPVYDRLRELVSTGSVIAFVGAGASAPLYPLWAELLCELVHEAEAVGAENAAVQYWKRNAARLPMEIAAQIRNKLGDESYYALLRRMAGIYKMTLCPEPAAVK